MGGTSVKVNEEFMVTMSLMDDTCQILEGWTIDRITDTLSFVDLGRFNFKESKSLDNYACSLHILSLKALSRKMTM